MWLKKFKIALIEKNLDNLSKLMKDVPQLQTKEEIEEALYLLKSANELVSGMKKETEASMIQVKKSKDFLKSTQAPRKNKFDIKS